MTFDLSWLWNLLNSIVDTFNSWFASLWTEAQNIANTGQGIFSGLIGFGSQLWDAITKAFDAFGAWIAEGLDFIRRGIENALNTFGQWLNNAYTFIAQGVSWIGSQLYNFGNWVYNSLLYVWNWIVNSITATWNAITTWFSGIASAIGTWWTSLVTTINSWWGNLVLGFRAKIIQTITADITITMAWKGAERILQPQGLKDIGYGMFGILASPIIGRVIGSIVDAVVPIPTSTTYPLIPSLDTFTYTPPSLTIETPTEPPPPSADVSGAPTGAFTGISEKTLPLDLDYDFTWMAGQSRTASLNTSIEVSVA